GAAAAPCGVMTTVSGAENSAGGAALSGAAAVWATAGDAPQNSVRNSALGARSRRLGHRRRGSGGDGVELQLVVLARDLDPGSGGEVSAQDELRERILQVLLDGSLEGARPERGVEAPLDEQLHGLGGDDQIDFLS